MSPTRFASLLFTCGLFACAADHGSGNPSGADGGNADGGGPPPFTMGVSTLAGSSDAGAVDGSRDAARFDNPVNVAVGPMDGKIYVADFDNGLIRVVARDGTTATLIAKGGFSRPFGLAFAPDGTLYVSTDNDDAGNHSLMSGTVWKVDVNAKTATVIARAVGRPRGLAVLGTGQLLLSDDLHHVLETLDPTTGTVTLVAGAWDVAGYADGQGAAARFSTPYGVAVQADGTILVADWGNQRIRTLTPAGAVATMAGSGMASFGDGSMSSASFDHPEGLAIAPSGDIVITDTDNYRVRRIHGTQIDTIAGDGNAGYLDSDDPLSAELYGLEGIAVAPDGMVFIADGNRGDPLPYNRIRQVQLK